MRYVRSPAAFFDDSTFSPPLLPRMLMNPRTVCACQPVASMISASVAPFARCIIAIISAFLLLRASVARFCVPARRALPALLGSAAFALFLALGAPFVLVASLFEGAFSGATCAPCSATVAALSLASAFVMLIILFCAGFAHDDSSLQFGETARQICVRLCLRTGRLAGMGPF